MHHCLNSLCPIKSKKSIKHHEADEDGNCADSAKLLHVSRASGWRPLQVKDLSFLTAEFHQSGFIRGEEEEEEAPEGIKTAQR